MYAARLGTIFLTLGGISSLDYTFEIVSEFNPAWQFNALGFQPVFSLHFLINPSSLYATENLFTCNR
jgi:hypothetical protein